MLVCVCVYSSANATPAFEGRGGEELATEITNLLYRAYSASTVIDVASLCLQSGKLCWVLYVDVLVSSNCIIILIRIIIIIALLKCDTPVVLASMCFTNNVIHQ